MQLNELQQVARAAARVHVSGPGLNEPRLLFAHSMQPSISRPWDNLDAELTAPEGTMLWSLAEPCMPAFERVESPHVTGDLGSRLGLYVHFPEPGMLSTCQVLCHRQLQSAPCRVRHTVTEPHSAWSAGDYTIRSQAEFEGNAVFSKHTVHACAWSSSGAWSDPCMWDQKPDTHGHVIIELGMHMTLDEPPPPLSSLTVRCLCPRDISVTPCCVTSHLLSGTPLHISFQPTSALSLHVKNSFAPFCYLT